MNAVVFEVAGARILVTGATGLIGGGLARRLLGLDAHVRAFVRRPADAERLRGDGMEVVLGDLTDASSLAEAVADCDAVAHFAGALGREVTPWATYMAVNVEGTRSLLAAAVASGVGRFLHASSAWAYGFDAKRGTDEHCSACFCGDPYCDTKLLSENIVLDAARQGLISAVVVQPSQIYGPGDRTWTAIPLRMMRRGMMVVPGHDGGRIQPLFVTDVVEGALEALRRGGSGQRYILCGEQELSMREFFERYLALGTRQRRLLTLPRGALLGLAGLGEPLGRIMPNALLVTRTAVKGTSMMATYSGVKAREELGFVPKVGLDEGMAAVREWALQERLL